MKGNLSNLKARLPSGDRLYAFLAIAMIAVVVMGYGIVTASSLVPGVRAWQELSAKVEAAHRALADAQSAQAKAPETLRQKVAAAKARRSEAASMFVSEGLASELPTRLYQYAGESGVEILSLQSQAAQSGADKALYSTRSFDLQALGPLPRLVDFVSRIGEAHYKGFVISNVNIAKKDDSRHSLSMSVTLYISPYVGGTPAAGADGAPTPLPVVSPAPRPGPSPTATALPTATATPPPQPTVYTVRSGDTLFSIARRYGTSVEAIMAANGMQGTTVRAGEQLLIPVP